MVRTGRGSKGSNAHQDCFDSVFDLVLSTVPDYMHGVLLGVTQTLLMKWFFPSQSGQPYFIGKHIQAVSKCLFNIKPPLHIERLSRNIEKHFASLKATELQMWLFFYGGPCFTGILPKEYLTYFAHFSEAIFVCLYEFLRHVNT
jgi:hypothetical protein